jgi:hypothetical protein
MLIPLKDKASTIFVDDEQVERTKGIIGDELAQTSYSVPTPSRSGYRKIEATQFHNETKEVQSVVFSPDGNKRQALLSRE